MSAASGPNQNMKATALPIALDTKPGTMLPVRSRR